MKRLRHTGMHLLSALLTWTVSLSLFAHTTHEDRINPSPTSQPFSSISQDRVYSSNIITLLTPKPSSTLYLYPSSFPIAAGSLTQSNLFNLREKTSASNSTPDGNCLKYESEVIQCPSGAAGLSASSQLLSFTCFASAAIAGDNLAGYFLTILGLSFLAASTCAEETKNSIAPIDIGTNHTHKTTNHPSITLSLSDELPLLRVKRASNAFQETEKVTATFKTEHCSTDPGSCSQQLFRYEKTDSRGDYGLITLYGHSVSTDTPLCLTKENDNTLSVRHCAYILNSSGEQVFAPEQLWFFEWESDQVVVNRLHNLSDTDSEDFECIAGITGVSDGINNCRRFYYGQLFLTNDCPSYPDRRPTACGVKQ